MLFKILIFFVLGYFVIRWIYRLPEKSKNPKSSSTKTNQNQIETQPLNSCPICGTYFQDKQGVSLQGKLYCSEACLKKA